MYKLCWVRQGIQGCIMKEVNCGKCDGLGRRPGFPTSIECGECDGTGKLTVLTKMYDFRKIIKECIREVLDEKELENAMASSTNIPVKGK